MVIDKSWIMVIPLPYQWSYDPRHDDGATSGARPDTIFELEFISHVYVCVAQSFDLVCMNELRNTSLVLH